MKIVINKISHNGSDTYVSYLVAGPHGDPGTIRIPTHEIAKAEQPIEFVKTRIRDFIKTVRARERAREQLSSFLGMEFDLDPTLDQLPPACGPDCRGASPYHEQPCPKCGQWTKPHAGSAEYVRAADEVSERERVQNANDALLSSPRPDHTTHRWLVRECANRISVVLRLSSTETLVCYERLVDFRWVHVSHSSFLVPMTQDPLRFVRQYHRDAPVRFGADGTRG